MSARDGGADGVQQVPSHMRASVCIRCSGLWQPAGQVRQHPGVSPLLQLPPGLVCQPAAPTGARPQQCAGQHQEPGLPPAGPAAQPHGSPVQQLRCRSLPQVPCRAPHTQKIFFPFAKHVFTHHLSTLHCFVFFLTMIPTQHLTQYLFRQAVDCSLVQRREWT